jgi:hypothetical protein
MAEGLFAAVKAERSGATTWPTRAAARLALCAGIDVRWNRQRRHAARQLLLWPDLAA